MRWYGMTRLRVKKVIKTQLINIENGVIWHGMGWLEAMPLIFLRTSHIRTKKRG